MKTVVIYHRADFDGIFCREIARKFLPGAELIGWDYGDPVPAIGADVQELYILDLSVEELMSDPRLIWIDHHKSAMEKYAKSNRGYRIDGVAACRLAWQYFTWQNCIRRSVPTLDLPGKVAFVERRVSEPTAVRLAGEYDIWDKRDPNAEVFQFGLRSRDLTDADWQMLLQTDPVIADGLVDGLLCNGRLLQRYQQDVDASTVKSRSFEVAFEGLRFLALNTPRCNSLTFAAAVKPEHDGLMGFFWNGESWAVSLYGAGKRDIDLSVIAVKFGGGGHRQACGFRVKELPFLVSKN